VNDRAPSARFSWSLSERRADALADHRKNYTGELLVAATQQRLNRGNRIIAMVKVSGRPDHKKRRRVGRPPGGAHPGEKVMDYPQVSLRIPPMLKSQLYALSIIRSKPQWRILIDAIECVMRELPESEKRMVDEIAKGCGR
jgi:hypothetical protein